MKLDKRSRIFITILLLIIFIPVIIIGGINYAKEQKLKNRIENSKATRILTLNTISTAIAIDELFEIELSKKYIIENDINARNEKVTTITYTNATFLGVDCKKKYTFYDDKLGLCIFDIDTSHWRHIYEELVKLNGEPDETDIEPDDESHYDMYIWYGKNGTLIMGEYKFLRNIEVSFEPEE